MSINLLNVVLLFLGGVIHTFSYGSIEPLIVVAFYFMTVYLVLILTPLGLIPERRMFNRVFSVGFLMSGIAAVYGNQFHDELQMLKDAGNFFELSAGGAVSLSLAELKTLSEGSLAIVIWRSMYDFLSMIGFEKARYIGIFINVTAVSLSGVVGIKIVRRIFGNDEDRFRRLTILVASCGMFWLFAGIHIRDSIILLAVTALTYAWVRFLTNPGFGLKLLQIVFWNLLSIVYFGLLRTEFTFIPVAMTVAAVVAIAVKYRSDHWRFALYSLAIVIVIVLTINYVEDVMSILNSGRSSYAEQSAQDSGANSLGMIFIVDQPIPIRLVLGSIYLFVFPIPFWSGFSFESAYALFKSANAIFFYFVLPMLYLALKQLIKHSFVRTPALLFIVFLVFGFTFSIAGTSLETRHLGVFLIPVFVLAMVPDFRVSTLRNSYKKYLTIVLFGVAFVHISWIIMKLL
jgi:hypothetical protein